MNETIINFIYVMIGLITGYLIGYSMGKSKKVQDNEPETVINPKNNDNTEVVQ